MKKKFTLAVGVLFAAVTSQVAAQCPMNLTAEQKMECITAENAGYFYPLERDAVAIERTEFEPVVIEMTGKKPVVVANRSSNIK